MKGIRLEGAALRLAANLAGTAAGRFLLRKQVEGVFGIDRLMSLPTVARMPLDNLPQVVAGAPPRSWGNGDCGLPAPRSRQGTREIAAKFASGETTARYIYKGAAGEDLMMRVVPTMKAEKR